MRLKADNDYYRKIIQAEGSKDEFISKHPDWKGELEQTIFIDHIEPLTDPIGLLTEALSFALVEGDRVLSTPLQVKFFPQDESLEINVFDISLGQIIKQRIIDTLQGLTRDYWWIDLFDKKMLSEALAENNISVLYVSNIIEWAANEDHIKGVVQTVDESSVRSLLFTSINTFNSRNKLHFINLMKKRAWQPQIFSNRKGESVILLTRINRQQ